MLNKLNWKILCIFYILHYVILLHYILQYINTYVLSPCSFSALPSVFNTVGWTSGRASSLYKIEWWGTGRLFVWSVVQMICIWSSWCHFHPIISCFSKIQNGLPFWCRLTRVVLEKWPLNVCVCLCVCVCVFCLHVGYLRQWPTDHQLHCQVARLCSWCQNTAWVCTVCWFWEPQQATVRLHSWRQWLHAAWMAADASPQRTQSERDGVQHCTLQHTMHHWKMHWGRQTPVALSPQWAACRSGKGMQDHLCMPDPAQQGNRTVSSCTGRSTTRRTARRSISWRCLPAHRACSCHCSKTGQTAPYSAVLLTVGSGLSLAINL